MKKARTIVLVLTGLGVLVGTALFLIGYFRKGNAGILVESTPPSSVYIASEQVGRTPYEANLKPGEVVVKLIPETIDRALAPFETKVILNSGIKTIIRRDFGETEEASAGDIVSFEKVGGKEVSISVVTVPNSAQISIDGQVRGFAPYKTTSLSAGEHSLVVSSQGYSDRTITIKAIAGYRLTVVFKLKPSGETVPEEKVQGEETQKKVMIEILSTPTGFLRVRESASTSAKELAQVKPGQRFPYLTEDTENNWYKIEYQSKEAGEEAKEGWVTGQYSKKVEVEVGASPSVSPTPTKIATPSVTLTPTKKPTPSPTPKPSATP